MECADGRAGGRMVYRRGGDTLGGLLRRMPRSVGVGGKAWARGKQAKGRGSHVQVSMTRRRQWDFVGRGASY